MIYKICKRILSDRHGYCWLVYKFQSVCRLKPPLVNSTRCALGLFSIIHGEGKRDGWSATILLLSLIKRRRCRDAFGWYNIFSAEQQPWRATETSSVYVCAELIWKRSPVFLNHTHVDLSTKVILTLFRQYYTILFYSFTLAHSLASNYGVRFIIWKRGCILMFEDIFSQPKI